MSDTPQSAVPMKGDVSDQCKRCGGGIDFDHPTRCRACLYEVLTGRSYEADVDSGAIREVRARLAAIPRTAPTSGQEQEA